MKALHHELLNHTHYEDIYCSAMKHELSRECEHHETKFECADMLIYYEAPLNEYGLIIHDGGPSYILMKYCPWCGSKLPESKRDEYFDKLENLGFEDYDDAPIQFQSQEWWKTNNS
jgi:hypothetical protein